MLEVKNLTVAVHGKPILEGLNLTVAVNDGEVAATVIMGPNGFVRDAHRQLPIEFAVDAQELIAIVLEPSVGVRREVHAVLR